MKRVAEKVRDIVEVRPFTHLNDFGADPALTLAGYHFTDITADLMGKWIDTISRVKPGHGAALALAGFRGVGKSHFLSIISALVANPELRPKVNHPYVSASADRLSRRHGCVVAVRRGVGTSLVDELRLAVAELMGVNPGTLSDSLYDLLLRASDDAGDTPLVVLIDTALGRETRVSRDDGPLISEIADAADTLGIFVGVALDDDISGADGPNSSISASFAIDYLDQEHLYKIVDAHIFTKHSQQLPLLREIYEYYRQVMPGFRWSEQRFTSLYPLHPATVEIAPLIRLYVHDFALLGFAAEAGVRILGRPANSLIGLDEVYDSVEKKLRAVPELSDAFLSFDSIEQQVVSKMPVHQRLHAKLLLKGLLMLSLNGQGTTSAEIAASMMIFADEESSMSIDVGELLDTCVEAIPGAIVKVEQDDRPPKYCFRLVAKSDVGNVMAEALGSVGDDIVSDVLLKVTADKFADSGMSANSEIRSTFCTVEWRGGIRRGAVIWNSNGVKPPPDLDWTVRLNFADSSAEQLPGEIVWKIAELAPDEKELIQRHHLMQVDARVRESLGDGLATAVHVHTMGVEKIWQRIFFEEARLLADGAEYEFSGASVAAHGLTHLFSEALSPIFEQRYPEHPRFTNVLDDKRSSALIADFFGGGGVNNADIQGLAETFAVPLGIALKQGDSFVPSATDILTALPIMTATFETIGKSDGSPIELSAIARLFGDRPFGLTREAMRLIMVALVSQRQFEFVTANGNRISHRSLDLRIIWEDIVGLAKPLNEDYAPGRLLAWAKLTTGNSGIKSLDRAEDRLLTIDSLSGWLSAWKESSVLADFDALSDENLNAQIWRTAASLKKTFGSMAEVIDRLVKDEISLDEALHAIAEHFSDSEAEFEKKRNELRTLGEFTKGVGRQTAIASYLSVCEVTDNAEVESARKSLLAAIDPSTFWVNAGDVSQVENLWQNFLTIYSGCYFKKHDSIMGKDAVADDLRNILASPEWSAFESLYRIAWADQRFVTKSRSLIREIRQLRCGANTEEILLEQPFCNCSFSLSGYRRLKDLPVQLRSTIGNGLSTIESRLKANAAALSDAAETEAMRSSVSRIIEELSTVGGLAGLSGQDIRLLKVAAERAADGSFDSFSVSHDLNGEEIDLFDEGSPAWDPIFVPAEASLSQ